MFLQVFDYVPFKAKHNPAVVTSEEYPFINKRFIVGHSMAKVQTLSNL
jgi:hypothetical protein